MLIIKKTQLVWVKFVFSRNHHINHYAIHLTHCDLVMPYGDRELGHDNGLLHNSTNLFLNLGWLIIKGVLWYSLGSILQEVLPNICRNIRKMHFWNHYQISPKTDEFKGWKLAVAKIHWVILSCLPSQGYVVSGKVREYFRASWKKSKVMAPNSFLCFLFGAKSHLLCSYLIESLHLMKMHCMCCSMSS